MKISRCLALTVCFLSLSLIAVHAQERRHLFELPDAFAGESYRVEIEQVLREKYRLKLESSAQPAIIQWALADGELPRGLTVQTDGLIDGRVSDAAIKPYQFRLRVVDVSYKDTEMILDFTVKVKLPRLRLSQIEEPQLRLVEARLDEVTAPDANSVPTTTRAVTDKRLAENSGAKPSASPEEDDPVFTSRNVRMIVGIEQSGAASAESQGKPFFDLFVNTPIAFGKDRNKERRDTNARFSIWGDVRLTSLAQQVTAFADVASNAITSITGGKVNQLVQGFDFTVGPQVRLIKSGKVHINAIAGFGAVSPLTPRESVQIYQVPAASSSQAAAFFDKFPGAQGKQYIGFVAQDRDRFLRQYFGGLRLQTFATEKAKTSEIDESRFPGTLDITFGQNEAVTGGRFHKFVFGLDGFLPLPIPNSKKALYLFGSAKFKALAPKMFNTPFLLDTAPSSVLITDPKVFIAEPTPSNRDVYKIGFGVDLFQLFKPKPKPTENKTSNGSDQKTEKTQTMRKSTN